jgi:ABC-2 type transport system ATP-binding protein
MAIVKVEDLSHSYNGHKALSGVTFDVTEGEIFGLLGPNGGGKTTLFRILSTLFPPSSGSATVLGLDILKSASKVRQRLGVVFQNPSLDIKLTVAENLAHQGHLYGLRGRPLRARIDEMMERLRITDRASDLVETLSGGLRRRVELAKGMLHGPELLILDEPSVGLDPGARHDLWQYLEQLRDSGNVTILVTTHLIDEADRCDRVLILHKGEVVGRGSPATLKEKIGGDIIALTTSDPEELRSRISGRFDLEPVVLDGTVRIEKQNGHQFIAQLIEAFPGMIDSVTLAKPTLEDVFIDRTGHRFWEES